jgi:hypothetical protein
MSNTNQDYNRNVERMARLCSNAIEYFDLNLTELQVYTEAATGAYSVTAPIAAAAGAEKVYAISADSSYGSQEEAVRQTNEIASLLGCDDKICYITEKKQEHISDADIVTNSRFVRPINEETISWMKPTAVVALMFETWEFRDADIEIEQCWRRGIPVLGTDENDSRVRTQEYVGPLVLKLALNNSIELLKSNVILLGSGSMAAHAMQALKKVGADVTVVTSNPEDPVIQRQYHGRSLTEEKIQKRLGKADAIIVVEHWNDKELLGPNGDLSVEDLNDINNTITVIHVCGNIDGDAFTNTSIECIPRSPRKFGYMSFTLGYVGPRPIVDLQAGGLRVGQLLAQMRRSGADLEDTVDQVSDMSVAEDFSSQFKQKHNYNKYISQ